MIKELTAEIKNVKPALQQTHCCTLPCRLIFLDIDGVIATPESVVDGLWGLVESKQQLLGKIIEATDAKIVLSSSWRKHTLSDTIEYMNEKGFKYSDRIIGVTIRAYQYIDRKEKIHLSIPRGVEIKQWIDTNIHSDNGKDWHRKEYGKDYTFVILDDDSDMLLEQSKNYVNCHCDNGLTDVEVEKAITILNVVNGGF